MPDEGNPPARIRPALITKEAAEYWHKLLFSEDGFGIPKAKEVTRIRAQTHGPPFGAEIDPFDVPAAFHAKLLEKFKDCRIDRDPIISMPEVGSLLICVGHKKEHLIWYGGANGAPLMFSWQGVRCVSNRPPETINDTTVLDIIEQAAKADTK
jgi:hypothetical protein